MLSRKKWRWVGRRVRERTRRVARMARMRGRVVLGTRCTGASSKVYLGVAFEDWRTLEDDRAVTTTKRSCEVLD